jgi:hypothetical protein
VDADPAATSISEWSPPWVCGQLASVSPHTYGWLTTAFQLIPACGVTGSCAMLE